VLKEAQRDLWDFAGTGIGILEHSHRGGPFERVIAETEADCRALAGIPASYKLLFLQGGASLQFAMLPANFLPDGRVADYIDTGAWSQKAMHEAAYYGSVHVAASSKAAGYSYIPGAAETRWSERPAYAHFTSNNTIFGTEWKKEPEVGAVPLVCDASSDIYSRPIDVSKHALIYAGAQKNLGPSGVTVVVVRDDLVGKAPATIPTMLDYKIHADNKSLYNTPPCFGIYILRLVVKWLVANGGLSAMGTINARKAAKVYAEIDRTGFYRGHAAKDSRSNMNITFRLPNEDLEKAFAKEATAAGLDGLKGHRSVGGLRASVYNAFPEDGINALVSFMKDFEKQHG